MIYTEQIGTNWILNGGIENFPKTKNILTNFKATTKTYECIYFENYNCAWRDFFITN